jgi:hypothetical protein
LIDFIQSYDPLFEICLERAIWLIPIARKTIATAKKTGCLVMPTVRKPLRVQ